MTTRKTPKTTQARTPTRARGHKGGEARRTGGTKAQTKTAALLALLARTEGASLEELQTVSGWQPHSVRGFLAGTVKKLPGLSLSSEKPAKGPRRYRVRQT